MTAPLIENDIKGACGKDCRVVLDCGGGARVAGVVKANPEASIRPALGAGVGNFSASCVDQGIEAATIARVAGPKLACEFGNPGLRGFWVLGGHKGVGSGVI